MEFAPCPAKAAKRLVRFGELIELIDTCEEKKILMEEESRQSDLDLEYAELVKRIGDYRAEIQELSSYLNGTRNKYS